MIRKQGDPDSESKSMMNGNKVTKIRRASAFALTLNASAQNAAMHSCPANPRKAKTEATFRDS